MKSGILTTAILCCLLIPGYAQYKTTVKFSSAAIVIPGRYSGLSPDNYDFAFVDSHPYDQWGLYAERMFSGNWGAGIGYSYWNKLRTRSWYSEDVFRVNEDRSVLSRSYDTEYLTRRSSYKMIDLYGFYRHNLYKRHFLKAGLGASLTWGDDYMESMDRPEPWDSDYITGTLRVEKSLHLGLMPQITYDFIFLRDRLNAGTDFRLRKYSGMDMVQFDLGLHIGVNF